MQKVPILQKANKCTNPKSDYHTTLMALCMLGARHDWPPRQGPGKIHLCAGSIRQIHKVDRVQACHTQSADRVVEFIYDMLYRFGFPNTIITDLGCNFTSDTFWDFCKRSAIDVKYVSIAQPRANGQVEQANGMILEGLKKRLYEANSKKGGKWISKLPMLSGVSEFSHASQRGRHHSS